MRKYAKAIKVLVPTFFLVSLLAFFIVSATQAAALQAVYISLSRLKSGLNGSTGQEVEIILAIDPATTIPTGGTITIEFPDAEDTTWCRVANTLSATAVSSSAVDMSGTNWAIDSGLPSSGGALAAACTQGSGTGSVDTITISNVGELTAGTTYGVKISNGATGRIGTNTSAGEHLLTITAKSGAVLDSMSFKIYLLTNDAVVITAEVKDLPTVSCTIGSNAVDLGALYPGGTFAIGSHTISTSTTASGYYWAAYGTGDGSSDAGLYKSTPTTHLIPSGPTDTLDLTNASISGFGLTLSDPDAGGTAIVTGNFVDTTFGTFGTLDRLYSGAKLLLYQNGSQISSEQSTVTYGAKADIDAPAGSYQETVYFVCGAYY